MRQFVVYRNRNKNTRALYPLLLNIQSDLIEETGTRVVVPMVAATRGQSPPSISSLAPVMEVNGAPYVLVVPLLAATEIADLGSSEADLTDQRSAIMAALDLLISGI